MTLRLLALDFDGTKLASARMDVNNIDVEDSNPDVVAIRRAATPPGASASREVMWQLANWVAEGAVIDAVGVSFGGPVDATCGVVRASLHVRGWTTIRSPRRSPGGMASRAPCTTTRTRAHSGSSDRDRALSCGRPVRHCQHRRRRGSRPRRAPVYRRPWVVRRTGAPLRVRERPAVLLRASGLPGSDRERPVHRPQRVARPAPTRNPLRASVGADRSDAVDLAGLDARAVVAAAQCGDEVALAVLAEAGRALGIGLAAAVIVCDPAAIVLGGGVIKSGEPLLGPARAVLRERAFAEPPQLLTSTFDLEAPLYGAAAAVDVVAPPAAAPGRTPPIMRASFGSIPSSAQATRNNVCSGFSLPCSQDSVNRSTRPP